MRTRVQTHTGASGSPELDATIRLHASDIEHCVSGAATVGNLVAATATYIAVITLFISGSIEIPPVVEAFVPIPLVAILCYHVTVLAAIIRRARSAEILEGRLKEWAALPASESARVGTIRSDEILDLRRVMSSAEPGFHKVAHTAALLFPYVGWYLLGAAATAYVIFDSYQRWTNSDRAADLTGVDVWLIGFGAVLSLIGWIVLASSAIRFYLVPPQEPAEYLAVKPELRAPEGRGLASHAPGIGEQTAALIRLHESDIHGNVGANGMGITFFATIAAYIALVATSYDGTVRVAPWIFCLAALPVLLLQGYLMLLIGGVLARSDSAHLLEDRLFRIGGLDKFAARNAIGTAQSDVVTDLRYISAYSRAVNDWRMMTFARESIALAPYVGIYATGLAATILTFVFAWGVYLAPSSATPSDWWQVLGVAAIYAAFWASFLVVSNALYNPRSRWRREREAV